MPAEGPGAKDGHEVTSRGNDPRLRWYPRSWRARYGDELAALLDDEYGRSAPARIRLSLVSGGLRQRARQSGLTGDAVPAADGVRAGALVVLVAWIAFVVAGASFAKFSEHFDEALPHSLGAHHVPDLAFTVLQALAGAASILVAAGSSSCCSRLCAISANWRLGLSARALPASPHLYGLDHRRDSAPPGVGQPPPIASTQRWYPLERGPVPGVDSPHRHHLDIMGRGGGRGRSANGALEGDAHYGGDTGRRRCCRNGDHGRCHCGLVGRNGDRRTLFLERKPGRAPGIIVGPLVHCDRRSDGSSDGYRRSRSGSRSSPLDNYEGGLNWARRSSRSSSILRGRHVLSRGSEVPNCPTLPAYLGHRIMRCETPHFRRSKPLRPAMSGNPCPIVGDRSRPSRHRRSRGDLTASGELFAKAPGGGFRE